VVRVTPVVELTMYLWRAVDEGEVLDMLVQRQQDIS
jgi:transposase-like protein